VHPFQDLVRGVLMDSRDRNCSGNRRNRRSHLSQQKWGGGKGEYFSRGTQLPKTSREGKGGLMNMKTNLKGPEGGVPLMGSIWV